MKNKRVFVTGGAGVIGTALVNLLLSQGHKVFVGDLKPCPAVWKGKLQYWQGDLNAIRSEIIEAFNPQIIFHLAATFERSEESFEFYSENFHHNVKLSHSLMNMTKQLPDLEKVVFASSYLIYDPRLYSSQDKVVSLSEDSIIYPRNTCGAAKLFHEIELRFLSHFLPKIEFISARIFRVYGIGSQDVISRWIKAALQNEEIQVYQPENTFDYIYAGDVAEGLLRLSQTNYSGIVNLGTGQARSIQEVVTVLKKLFPNLKTNVVPSDIESEKSQADMRHFQTLTRWKPTHTLETAIPILIQNAQISQKNPDSQCAVLITSLSMKIPLLNAVRKASQEINDFKIIHGSDSNPNCLGQYLVDNFWNCPPLEKLTIEDVLAYCQKNHIEAIIPTRDADLEFYSKHKELLKENNIQVMVSDPDSIQVCRDKKQFSDTLLKKGFPAISTELSPDKITSERFVVKERHGAGALEMGLNMTREQALKHSQKMKEPIFQPYIEGKEFSIDLYLTRKGKIQGCIARERNVVVNGESQVTTTVSYPALEKLGSEVAHALSLNGHVLVQVIEDSKGDFHIVECNPRFGGASTASLAVGLNSFVWFFAENLGLDLTNYPFIRHPSEIRQVRHATDTVIPWF